MNLKGKVALVTGSTGGIGLGIAQMLAQGGAALLLNGFGDAAEIEKLRADTAKKYGVRVAYHGADISKPSEVKAMVEQAHKELGSLDILVNNAGVQFTSSVEDFPDKEWDRLIAIDLSGPFYTTRAVIPGTKAAAGDGLSISLQHTAWSPARRSPPMSPPNTAW